MSRLHGKDLTTLTFGGQDLKSSTIDINTVEGADTHDTTAIGDQYHKFTAGLKGGDDLTWNLFYDNTVATGSWAYLTNLLGGVAGALVLGDGVRTDTYAAIVTKIARNNPVAEMVKMAVTLKLSGTFSHA